MSIRIHPVGQAFAGNSVNAAIFRGEGIISDRNYVYYAYYRSFRTIIVGVLNNENGAVAEYEVEGEFDLSDAHNVLSIGMCHEGHLFIAIGQHCGPLRVLRALRPRSIENWTDVSGSLGDPALEATYPAFIRTETSLFLSFRTGRPFGGNWTLTRFDSETSAFVGATDVLAGAYSKGKGSSPYPFRVASWAGRLALMYLWRTNSVGGRDSVLNLGVDFLWLDADKPEAFDSSGFSIGYPVTQLCSPRVLNLPLECDIINQCGMDCLDGIVHAAFYFRPSRQSPLYWCYLRGQGERWTKYLSPALATQFKLRGKGTLALPYSRPAVIAHPSGDVFLVYRISAAGSMVVQRLRSPEYLFLQSDLKKLDLPDVGYAEPVIDYDAWRNGNILRMYVQRCAQPNNEGTPESVTDLAYICSIDIFSSWEDMESLPEEFL